MKGLLSRRPSPALLISIVALVVAMAGTGYAAFKLPKNSVGTKQLKKNAVTAVKIKSGSIGGDKVKQHTLTGENIDLSQLGTVPSAARANFADSAARANVADSANGIPPAEATHLVGTPGEPPFEDGSSNYGTVEGRGHQSAGFFKDHEGIVHLQGFVKVGEKEGGSPITRIFSLPPGYRPAAGSTLYFNTFCSPESGECEDNEHYAPLLITGSDQSILGTVLSGAVLTLPNTIVSLEGITFRAEG